MDLSVKFLEPTVGGLTGKQLSLLREISCDLEDCSICESEDD